MTQTYSDALVNDLMARNAAEQDSAVRTRKQQVEDAYLNDGDFTMFQEFDSDDFEKQLIEAEARGAAEQRRKDVEGQEPVAWVYASELPERENNMVLSEATLSPRKTHYETTPLYTRPANVAALEARIAELQAENLKFHDLLCRAQNNVPECYEVWHVAARAALTREGGV